MPKEGAIYSIYNEQVLRYKKMRNEQDRLRTDDIKDQEHLLESLGHLIGKDHKQVLADINNRL